MNPVAQGQRETLARLKNLTYNAGGPDDHRTGHPGLAKTIHG